MTRIIRRNPFNNTLSSELINPLSTFFDDVLEKEFPEFFRKSGVSITKGSYPKINVTNFENKFVVEAEIPGLSKKDIKIKLKEGDKKDGHFLTIEGQKQEKECDDDNCGELVYCELKRSQFARTIQLHDLVDTVNIEADFNNGVLNIILPKVVPKEIEDNEQEIKIK